MDRTLLCISCMEEYLGRIDYDNPRTFFCYGCREDYNRQEMRKMIYNEIKKSHPKWDNLCDYCSKHFAECDGEPVFDEESETGDLVILCSGFKEEK